MTVELQYLLALYALAVTIGLGILIGALLNAHRAIKLMGLAAEARQAIGKVEESVKKTIDEAEEIIKQAKAKVKTTPKTRSALQKEATKAILSRKSPVRK